jgi:predicted phosphodiesterase
MSESLEETLKKLVEPGEMGSDTRIQYPDEKWRPRLDVDMDNGGFVVSRPQFDTNGYDAQAIMKDFGLNPEEWSVTNVRMSRWQRWDEEWLVSYRLSLVPNKNVVSDKDIEDLKHLVSKWKPSKSYDGGYGEGAYVVALSDQQLGKKVANQGTKESVERILELTDRAIHRLKDLRKVGRKLDTIVLALLGDHVEGNTSQAGKLQSQSASDLGQTEQVRVARRLLLQQIKVFASLCDELIVAVVNGNHDEVTRQVSVDPSDGWNVEIASQVQDICAENDALEHVVFRYPEKSHQTLTVDVCGTLLGLFHGHQFSRDVVKYLSGQATGQTALGMADVWLSGHYHHFQIRDIGERVWMQAPTTDPGSAWFRDRAGWDGTPGLLTFTVGEGLDPRQDICVLTTTR